MSKRCKKNKRVRCLFCNKLFEINEENTYEVDGAVMYFCPYCGEEQTKDYDFKIK